MCAAVPRAAAVTVRAPRYRKGNSMNVVTAYLIGALAWAAIFAYESSLQVLLYTPLGVSGIAMGLMLLAYPRLK